MNPPAARSCLDCNAMLQRNIEANTPVEAGEAARRRREIDKSTGFDDITQFYQDTATDPGEGDGGTKLNEIERFDRDESKIDNAAFPGIERFGEGEPAAPADADPIERSRAYEVETKPLVSDEPDEGPVAFAVDLETFEEANLRMSDVGGEFQKGKSTEQHPPSPPPGTEPHPQPLTPSTPKKRDVPRHRSPWERSDVEIMTSIRRRAIAQGILGTSLPLAAIGLAIILIGQFVILPHFVPSGTWNGTMIDRTGDGGLIPFTLELRRDGDQLAGQFWLAREAGARFDPGKAVHVPYVLEGAYRNAPLAVAGQFTREGFTLSLVSSEAARAPSLTWDGKFSAAGKAEGKLVSGRGSRAAWSMMKRGLF